MKHRHTYAIIFTVTLIGLLSVFYLTASRLIRSTLAGLEEERVRENFSRVQNLVREELASLGKQAGDWAGWDESCEFIENGNAAFIKRNLPDKTFADLQLSMIMFVHPSGKVVYQRWYDLQQAREAAPQDFAGHVGGNSRLLSHSCASSSETGVISLPNGPMLVAARPIVTTERSGPVRGTLIMGRNLDAIETERLSQAAQVSFSVTSLGAPYVPADLVAAQRSLSNGRKFVISRDGSAEVAGYGLLNDLYGTPSFMLKTSINGSRSERKLLPLFALMFAGGGALFAAANLFFVQRFVFPRPALTAAPGDADEAPHLPPGEPGADEHSRDADHGEELANSHEEADS